MLVENLTVRKVCHLISTIRAHIQHQCYTLFSEHFGKDPRIDEIKHYTLQNNEVISILEELSAKQTEVVDKTPLDHYEDNIALKMIDQRILELYQLVLQNPEIIRDYVENAIEPLRE